MTEVPDKQTEGTGAGRGRGGAAAVAAVPARPSRVDGVARSRPRPDAASAPTDGAGTTRRGARGPARREAVARRAAA